jgi:hypothetical protein
MPTPNDRLKIELLIDSAHPDLLEGLDEWLRLGLISDRQVLLLAKNQLCQPLPITENPFMAAAIAPTPSRKVVTEPAIAIPAATEDDPFPALNVVPSPPPPKRQTPPQRTITAPAPPRQPSWAEQVLESFMAEVAVIWLLFLGVFLVVASSAAIAAIQWRSITPVTQYSILLGYTLAFGGAGLWAGAQDKLKVTGRMLQIATLLIIPVNFWMMDGFRLWAFPMGWVMIAVGTIALGLMQWRLLQTSSPLTQANSLLLNALQWGWQLSFVPISFTYIGTVATAFVQAIAQRSRNTQDDDPRQILSPIAIGFATLLLVSRAVFVAGVPLSRFGLALGIVGWLFYWLDRDEFGTLWQQVGAALLGGGWLISFLPDPAAVTSGFDPLWQTLAISGLGLWVMADRLHRFWETPALVAFWAIGLQTYTVLRVIFPVSMRRSIMTTLQEAANLQAGAFELTGIGFSGYILFTLGLAYYLQKRDQRQLATLTKQLALGLGLLLALPSLFSPLVRAVYCSFSAAIVLFYWWCDRRSPETSRHHYLIYLAHASGVIGIISWIQWAAPQLQTHQWASILLGGALLEWGLAAVSRDRFWQKSAWMLGLAQAACAYPLLLQSIDMSGQAAYRGLPWLLVPAALTGLGTIPRIAYRRESSVLSIVAAVLSLFVTFTDLNPLLIALAVSTILLIINTHQLRHISIAAIGIGTGLMYSGLQAWSLLGRPEPRWYVLGMAIGLWLLWLWRDGLDRWDRRQTNSTEQVPTALLFLDAANGWGIAGALAIGTILGFCVGLGFVDELAGLPWHELTIGGAVAFFAILYRISQQPTNLGLWGLAIGAELLINLTAEWLDAPLAYRLISTMILAFGTLLIGEWWQRDPDRSTHWTSFYGVPLFYGAMALLLGHLEFTATTGFATIAVACLALTLGRRSPNLLAASMLGLVGITIGAYEWLIHFLMQSSGGNAGDGITLLAMLAAILGLAYSGLKKPLNRFFHIPRSSVTIASLLHWAGGSAIGLMAPLFGLSSLGEWLWIGTMAILATTVTWQGRRKSVLIYPALLQWSGAIAFLLKQFLPDQFLLSWLGLFAAVFMGVIYLLPWADWGWDEQPWHNGSLGLPLIAAIVTLPQITVPTLLLIGGSYGVLAWQQQRIRLSYWGVGFACWGLWRWLSALDVSEPVWYVGVFSLALMYIIEVEPSFQVTDARQQRHLMRCGAIGMFCLTLFYQGLITGYWSALTLAIALGLITVGILRRTRAYLYVGTLTFLIAVLRTLWIFVLDYSLLLWAIGIAIGCLLIWIAATFESRRSQTIAFVQYWLDELGEWE